MGLLNKLIPSFMGGVSQQPHTLRLPDQCELLENAYPSLVHGLLKRPGTEIISEITSNADSSTKFHLIDRDSGEQYIVLFTGDASDPIEVYDVNGVAQTVQYGDITSGSTVHEPSGYSDTSTCVVGYNNPL